MADDPHLALLRDRHRGVLVTLRGNGRPQLSVVDYTYGDSPVIRISTTAGRAKVRNLQRDPRASMHVATDGMGVWAVGEGTAELSPVAADPHDATVEELIESTGRYRVSIPTGTTIGRRWLRTADWSCGYTSTAPTASLRQSVLGPSPLPRRPAPSPGPPAGPLGSRVDWPTRYRPRVRPAAQQSVPRPSRRAPTPAPGRQS